MKKRILALLLAAVMVFGLVPTVAAAEPDAALLAADALHGLGLFQGTGTNDDGSPVYALERVPSRLEALTMLVRVLGKERDALSTAYRHPFTDVQTWANSYVGYAYNNGLTNGVGATSFGDSDVDARQYLTFVLRALGYSDSAGGDFTWDDPFPLAAQAGIISAEDDLTDFRRGDIATISCAALNANLKGSEQTLAQKLLANGAFTQAQYNAFISGSGSGKSVLTATEISEKCAPAVFYIETYSINGNPLASGSGFLIDPDGLAVTNYHVVADAYNVLAMTTDDEVYFVTILDGDQENDLALIRLEEAHDMPYLELDPDTPLKQGQAVYALGSPLGLDNTLSQGIISNPNRADVFIQISVPIAHGSSGGPLLNESGHVIGVVTAGFVNSSGDLNLATPISKLDVLDMDADANLFLPSWETYPMVDYGLDFGTFSGARVLQEVSYLKVGAGYVYDMKDFHELFGEDDSDRYAFAMYMYEQLLLDQGFEITSEEDHSTLYSRDTEMVRVTLDYDKMEITVMPMLTLQRYKEINLLDFGWCIGTGSEPATMMNGSYIWSYPWYGYYTVEETAKMIGEYLDLLEWRGYKFVAEDKDSSTFLYENKDFSVALSIGERNIYIDVLPLR